MIGLILLILVAFAVVLAVAYFSNRPSDWKSNPPEKKYSLSERFGISLGGGWPELSDKELGDALDDIAGLGFKWIRFDISWERAQQEENGHIRWEIFDRIVPFAAKRKLNLLPILTYAPKWASRLPDEEVFFQYAPANPDQFADFAGKAARRYAPLGIHAYEIWNEPNMKGFWEPAPNPKDYANLLKKSYIKIKKADPKAIVISGGLAPVGNKNGNISAFDFLEGIYKNKAKNYFNALGFHPYSFPDLPSKKISPSGWWARMSNPFRSIRSIMDDNSDGKKQVWGTEFGVPTAGRGDVSEALQARSLTDAAKEMQKLPWLRVLFIHTYKDLGSDRRDAENFFGLVRYDGSKKPAYYTIKKLLKKEKKRENKRY